MVKNINILKEEFDSEGYDRDGCSIVVINKETGTRYDKDGYDKINKKMKVI